MDMMQSNRLNLINKVKLKNNDKTTFYSPSLIRAFKETLFIPRPNTNVLDISKNYADIFYSLMFDSDEESSSKHCKAVRERIKSYRLWNLAEDDCNFIIMIIQNVIDNYNNGDQFSQLMLLEKMFGLYTIAYFWENMDSFNAYNLFALATMRRFGYCLLHQQHINTMVSEKAHSLDVKYVVERFIYPICSNMLKRILKTILKSLENYDCEQRVGILNALLLVCADNSNTVFTADVDYTLQQVPSEMLVEMITAMNGLNVPGDTISDFELQLMGIVKLEDSDGMKNYLKKFSANSYHEQFYNKKYRDIDYKLLYDPSFYDLTFTDKHTISKYELNKILNPHS